jgi:ferrous iron transport protein A
MEKSRDNQNEPVDGDVTTLDRILPPGNCRVVSVTATGSFRRRLLALGFVPGTLIESVRVAPLGDPIEYRIKGYYLSLRKEDARFISVKREAGQA